MLSSKIEFYTDSLINSSLEIVDEEILETMNEATILMNNILANNFDLAKAENIINDLIASSFFIDDFDTCELLFEVSQFIEMMIIEVHREEVS